MSYHDRPGTQLSSAAVTLLDIDAHGKENVIGKEESGVFQFGYTGAYLAEEKAFSLNPKTWKKILARGEMLEFIDHERKTRPQMRAYCLSVEAALKIVVPRTWGRATDKHGIQTRYRLPRRCFNVYDAEDNLIKEGKA